MATSFNVVLAAPGFKHCRVYRVEPNGEQTEVWAGRAPAPEIQFINPGIFEVLEGAIASVGAAAVNQTVSVTLSAS